MQIIWISALVACGLSILLATLLVVAERYLANYGVCEINVNDGSRKMEVKGGSSLLSSLMSQGVFIPSACGGKGTCAYCKVKVRDGGGPLSPTEEPLLTQEEMENDMRISCQLKVRNDIAIEIPEELFKIRRYSARVESIRDLTHDIKEVRLELIDPAEIDFTPGQYIQLQTPDRPGNPSVYRAYSMSNPSFDNTHVETIIRLVPGGICTTWVFEELSEGDEVNLTGPFGEFRLSDTDAEMVWIAGGSGMAPFWSILRYMKRENIARDVTYFFGAVSKRDLFLVDELRELENEVDWFTFVPALSDPAEEDSWEGETGLITDVVDRHVQSDSQKEAYLCGSPGMIDAAIKVLKTKGISDERIFYDKFA